VPAALLESEMRDFEDAGLLLNSPYFSVLRKERNTDLIISLDFSDGDPFTVLYIPFSNIIMHTYSHIMDSYCRLNTIIILSP